jgi:hypothetical protein
MTREARVPKPAARQEVCLKRKLARKGQALEKPGFPSRPPNRRCVLWPVRAKRARPTGWGRAGSQGSQAGGPTGGVFKKRNWPVRAKRARPTGWGRAGRNPMTREARIPKPAAQQEVCLKRSLARKGQARTLYRLGQGGKDLDYKRGQGSQAGGPTGGVFKKKTAKRTRSTGWGRAGRIPMTREARVPKLAAQQEVCLKRRSVP